MFIDIHVHTRLFEPPVLNGRLTYTTTEELIDLYDQIGVEKGVVLPTGNPECAYANQSNEEVIEMARKYPDRIIPFCNIDPRSITNTPTAPLDQLLGHYKDKGCKGIGEVCINLPFLDPMVQNLFKHTEQAGLPLTFHIAPCIGGAYGLYDDPGLPQLQESLRRFPKLKFFGHSQAFWAEIARLEKPGDRFRYPNSPITEEGVVPKLMREYPNLYGDLSAGSGHNALARDSEYAVKFLDEFQNRLFFGTDICAPDICAPDTQTPLVDFLIDLRDSGKITEAVFKKIAKENAETILDLK